MDVCFGINISWIKIIRTPFGINLIVSGNNTKDTTGIGGGGWWVARSIIPIIEGGGRGEGVYK